METTSAGVPVSKHLSTREKLIQAGIEMFSKHGFEATTTRMIADAVGSANNAAVFFYFGSKENLYNEARQQVANQMIESYRPLREAIEHARCDGKLTPVKAWWYIEQYVDLFISLHRSPEGNHIMFLLHEQISPAIDHHSIAQVAYQQGEQVLSKLLLEYWQIDSPASAAIASRLATSMLAGLAEHPQLMRLVLGLKKDEPLPEYAWQEIRRFALHSLQSFVPGLPADAAPQLQKAIEEDADQPDA